MLGASKVERVKCPLIKFVPTLDRILLEERRGEPVNARTVELLFEIFDEDGDGVLEVQELAHLGTNIGGEESSEQKGPGVSSNQRFQ